VIGVLTSMLGDGELPDQMDMPRLAGPSFDQVLIGGTPVGVSTGRTVSPTLRAMISLCVIDRATVTTLPFKPDHCRVDVTSL
jgi:vanillate/3-O-methylgallate O-demethylase